MDVVGTCVLCIWNAFIDRLPNPIRYGGKKSLFAFLSGNMYISCTKMATTFFRDISGRADPRIIVS